MKKLLYSSIVLTVFSLSVILFQISCSEEAIAKGANTQNKFLYSVYTGSLQFWVANIDGSEKTAIPISLPSGLELDGHAIIISNGEKLLFTVQNVSNRDLFIYSININGTDLKKVMDIPPTDINDQSLRLFESF